MQSSYGQEASPEDLVLREMASLQSDLTSEFERQRDYGRQASVHQEKVRKPLIDAVRREPQAFGAGLCLTYLSSSASPNTPERPMIGLLYAALLGRLQ